MYLAGTVFNQKHERRNRQPQNATEKVGQIDEPTAMVISLLRLSDRVQTPGKRADAGSSKHRSFPHDKVLVSRPCPHVSRHMSISPQIPACAFMGMSGSTRDVFLVDQHVLSGRGVGRSPPGKCVFTAADMIRHPSRPFRIEVRILRTDRGRERKGRSENHVSRALMLGSDQFVRVDMELDADTHKSTLVCLIHAAERLTERLVRPRARPPYDSSRRPSYRLFHVLTMVHAPIASWRRSPTRSSSTRKPRVTTLPLTYLWRPSL
jgi:hypothetical protein